MRLNKLSPDFTSIGQPHCTLCVASEILTDGFTQILQNGQLTDAVSPCGAVFKQET